jgi:hypothetical protein
MVAKINKKINKNKYKGSIQPTIPKNQRRALASRKMRANAQTGEP